MIFAVDVYYREDNAIVAGVLFENWDDAEPIRELTAEIVGIAEYEPGQFYNPHSAGRKRKSCIFKEWEILKRQISE
jgi:hypothetical protein